ncbi:MAG: hypothetical protein ACYC35_04905 [Pirellulales bacterium]
MVTRKLPFGAPPFRLLAEHFAQDAGFLEAAQQILKIDEDAYLRLAAQLAKADVFLSRRALTEVVRAELGEGSDRVASVIYRLADIVHDADMDATDAMDALGKAIENKADALQPTQRRTLTDRLRKLIVEPIGLVKQYKAQQLVDAIGAELDGFRIICDIRPIFDQKHERIEGAIPLAILRLEYSTPDGDSAVSELRVTEKQIAMLGERIADARLKLRMIKELLADSHVTIPGTKATISEDES